MTNHMAELQHEGHEPALVVCGVASNLEGGLLRTEDFVESCPLLCAYEPIAVDIGVDPEPDEHVQGDGIRALDVDRRAYNPQRADDGRLVQEGHARLAMVVHFVHHVEAGRRSHVLRIGHDDPLNEMFG